mmetsp:Transcript_3898/g.5957  ORF Transcript_3898/g.5957 Transcript_3898/m.5957 type:complete len:210 (-) Transcript_3898:2764-3393(-)
MFRQHIDHTIGCTFSTILHGIIISITGSATLRAAAYILLDIPPMQRTDLMHMRATLSAFHPGLLYGWKPGDQGMMTIFVNCMTIRTVGIILASRVVLGGIGNVFLTAVALDFGDRVRQHSTMTHATFSIGYIVVPIVAIVVAAAAAAAVIVMVVMVQGPMLILEKQKGFESTLCELSNFAVFAIVEYGVVEDEVGIIFELFEGLVLKAH